MNISTHPLAEQTIISLALACVAPEEKVEYLKTHASSTKERLLIEVEKFLLNEAERVLDDEAEFKRLYDKHTKNDKLQ